MKCAILSVGTEILFGQITNTNSVYLSQQLNLLGFDVLYHYTVGDNDERLAEIIKLAFKDCDLVIASGGLGPTEDDMTKETVCKVMGDHLVEHGPSKEFLLKNAAKLNHKLTENNFKQAMMPSQATVFDNDAGTAPGFALEKDGKTAICMFGNPEVTTGGRALKFYSSMRFDVRRIETIKQGDQMLGNRTRVKVVKNKVAPPFKQAEFDIMYGQGISRSGDVLDCAVEAGIIDKSGSWFSYDGERIGQGRENVKAYLEANPELLEKIHDLVMDSFKEAKEKENAESPAEEPKKMPDDINIDEDGVIIE